MPDRTGPRVVSLQMEVLETVDREQPRRRCASATSSSGSTSPSRTPRTSRRWARPSTCTRWRSRTRSSSASARSSTPTASTCCSSSTRCARGATRNEEVFEPVEVHIYVSGSFVITVRRAECTQLDALHPELDDDRPEGRGLHRLPRLRRPDRRLLPDHRAAGGAHRRARGGGAARPAAAGAPRRDLPPQAAHPRALAPRRAAARPLPRRLRGHPHPAGARARGARSTCATSATTSRRSRASCIVSRRT